MAPYHDFHIAEDLPEITHPADDEMYFDFGDDGDPRPAAGGRGNRVASPQGKQAGAALGSGAGSRIPLRIPQPPFLFSSPRQAGAPCGAATA